VVSAARRALDVGDVDLALPFVPAHDEAEVSAAFDRTLRVRGLGEDAREVADLLFFETVVRLHRAGEGAPYNGLRPAGLPTGPVLPLAERAVADGSPDALAELLTGVLRQQLEARLATVGRLAAGRDRSVRDARQYVEAMLGFEVYCHHLHQAMLAAAHG
jgi:hypothetical protein